jgi:uncharacterized membrane protein YvbJ
MEETMNETCRQCGEPGYTRAQLEQLVDDIKSLRRDDISRDANLALNEAIFYIVKLMGKDKQCTT